MKSRVALLVGDRPNGLVAIVVYKALVTIIFAIFAIALLGTFVKYEDIQELAEGIELAGKHRIVNWILEKVLNFSPRKLGFIGVASALYSAISGIEVVGLWQRRAWAHWLVIGLVGVSIFPEIYELIHGITVIKLVVFILNVLMLWYLLTHKPKHH
jgi:uncharacterized membrane protein (DUF2068 family)